MKTLIEFTELAPKVDIPMEMNRLKKENNIFWTICGAVVSIGLVTVIAIAINKHSNKDQPKVKLSDEKQKPI